MTNNHEFIPISGLAGVSFFGGIFIILGFGSLLGLINYSEQTTVNDIIQKELTDPIYSKITNKKEKKQEAMFKLASQIADLEGNNNNILNMKELEKLALESGAIIQSPNGILFKQSMCSYKKVSREYGTLTDEVRKNNRALNAYLKDNLGGDGKYEYCGGKVQKNNNIRNNI